MVQKLVVLRRMVDALDLAVTKAIDSAVAFQERARAYALALGDFKVPRVYL